MLGMRIGLTAHVSTDEHGSGKHAADLETQNPGLLFSDQEVDRLRIAFDMHADRGEAVLLRGHLKTLLKTLFIVPTKHELDSLTSKMDPDESGKIDFGSFFSSITAFMKPQYGKAMLDKAFDEISGGSDKIDSASLQRVMVRLGQSTIRLEDCEAMICEVDRQGDGFISKEDFHHLHACTFDNV